MLVSTIIAVNNKAVEQTTSDYDLYNNNQFSPDLYALCSGR